MNKIEEFIKNKLYDKKGTIDNYTYHIKKYFQIINKDMETYFDHVPPYNSKDPKKYNLYYEQDLLTFWGYLDNKAPKSKKSAMAALKQFLKYHDKQTTTLDIWETIKDRLKGKNKPVSEEHVPEIPDVKRVLEYCDIKTKTTIMMGLSSGARIGEIMKLEPRDIHMNETPTRINIRAEIAKNGQRRTTFITSETTEILKEWIRVRDDWIHDAYKSLNFKSAVNVKELKKSDPRIFPFSMNVVQRSFNDAATMAGFTDSSPFNGDNRTVKRQRKTLHFHNLRKFFRSNFGNVDLAEHLMGHSGYLTEYRDYSDKRLAEEYLKHQHNLLVYETQTDLSGINESLKEKDEQMKKMQKTIDGLEEFKMKILEQLAIQSISTVKTKKQQEK